MWMRKAIYSSLPLGVRLVYVALDDHCGQQGRCWYRQEVIAKKLDMSVRYLGQCIGELAERGLLRVERSRTHAIYILAWSDRNPSADLAIVRSEPECRPDRNPSADLAGATPLYDPQFLIRGRDSQCPSCWDSGVIGSMASDLRACTCEVGKRFVGILA